MDIRALGYDFPTVEKSRGSCVNVRALRKMRYLKNSPDLERRVDVFQRHVKWASIKSGLFFEYDYDLVKVRDAKGRKHPQVGVLDINSNGSYSISHESGWLSTSLSPPDSDLKRRAKILERGLMDATHKTDLYLDFDYEELMLYDRNDRSVELDLDLEGLTEPK